MVEDIKLWQGGVWSMDDTCIRVVTLSIVNAGNRFTADTSKWQEAFYSLKKEGIEPRIFNQLRFSKASASRPFSREVERLLFQFTRADGSLRENPGLRVIEI